MEDSVALKAHLEKIKQSNILIIVEGKKDTRALNKFGITNIVELSKKPLFQVVEEIASKTKECIILTDLDNEGKKLYGKLFEGLTHHGVKIDNRFREFLFKETKVRQVEGLSTYFAR